MGRRLCAIAVAALCGASSDAAAYEFWTRARTLGQIYELRGFRILGGEVAIGRQRLTQLVTLTLYDLGDLARERRRAGRSRRGPLVSWHATLRLEHDFGTYLTTRLPIAPTLRQDALDHIPELSDSALALSLLYGHLRVEGLAGDRVTLLAGRIAPLSLDAAPPFDGASAQVGLTAGVAVEVSGGLAVRESSWLGVSSYELDGAPGAFCHEYVEAASGGLGRWRLLRRDEQVSDRRFSSDYELCPQRQVRMPMAEVALAADGKWGASARVSYRIARSPTAGGVDEGDAGLFPDEAGQAPAWGTNLEQLAAVASGRWRLGALEVAPLAMARASLAHGVLDRLELSSPLRRGVHELTPAVSRVVPTFDADSIWNVLGGEASTELTLGYRYDGALRGTARVWGRRFDGGPGVAAAWAWGGDASASRAVARLAARPLLALGRAVLDGGAGGARLAADGELRWGTAQRQLAARAALVWVRPDRGANQAVGEETSGAASARARWALSSGASVQSALELARAGSGETSVRAFLALELTLEPNR